MNQKKRDIRIEFIRGLSMLIIVMYHYSCALEIKGIEGTWRPFWRFANGAWGEAFVIVFFMISGYVMMLQYEEALDIKQFYKKRWLSIFPMFYITWGCMYLVRTIQYKNPLWGGNPVLLIYSFLGMDGYLKNGEMNYYTVGEWFLGAIILLYLLFPLLRLLYIKGPFLVTIILSVLFLLFEITDVILFYRRTDMFFCIYAFWCGMIFWKYRKYLQNISISIISIIICIVLCFLDCTNICSEITAIHIFGISVFTLLYNLPIERFSKAYEIFPFLSKYSYAVMLVHQVLIYWGIRVFQILKISFNIGLFIVIISVYFVGICLYKTNKRMLLKVIKD